jgi:type IX secretion system PorP/SprF family membrane protein
MYNTLSVNPAYAGSNQLLNVSSLFRQQWIGIEGAPMSQNLFLHTPIINKNLGIGLNFLNDKVGPINQTSVALDYSYSIKVNKKARLNIGMKAMMNYIQADLIHLKLDEVNDNNFAFNYYKVTPNIGLGLYYHNDNGYVGISTPKIIETKISKNNTDATKLNRHYYIIGGYVFELNNRWKLKPAFLTKLTQNSPISVDLSLEAYYANRLSFGIMNRVKDSYGVLVGYRISDQLKVGMSFDQTISRLQNFNKGTYELFLSYDFLFKNDKIITPRYF